MFRILLFLFALPLFAFEVPRLRGPIVDDANIIGSRTESQLRSILQSLSDNTGTQLAILTVTDLQGEAIEGASIQVVDKWKLGNADTDRGLLLMISKKERKIRIEVGQGLEGDIPDAIAKRVIDQLITPSFRKGNFDQGIANASLKLIALAEPEFLSSQSLKEPSISRRKQGSKSLSLFKIIFFIILFLFFPRLTLLMGLSGGRGFGGRGGGGGFGGFSGGGGGFSGGGASGGW